MQVKYPFVICLVGLTWLHPVVVHHLSETCNLKSEVRGTPNLGAKTNIHLGIRNYLGSGHPEVKEKCMLIGLLKDCRLIL